MIVSTPIEVLEKYLSYEECVRKIASAGFDAYDFSMFDLPDPACLLRGDNYADVARKVKKAADSFGIACNQAHAPFPLHKEDDEEWNANIMGWVIRSLEVASILGAKICIVHPYNNWSPEENAERVFKPLLPYCKKFKIKVALENMWNWPSGSPIATPCACSTAENFNAHLDLLDNEWFVACLDIGHAEMIGDCASAPQLIRALGSRLQALHVHDNDRKYDLHSYPYTGRINWDEIYKALHEIGYSGDLTFEADSFMGKYPPELHAACLKLLETTGRYMVKRIKQ